MLKRNIPFFNYPHLFSSSKENFMKIFYEIGNRGAFIMQNDLAEFESEMEKFCECKFAIGVGNATDALEILIQASEITKGDEVIFSSHTMIATASAIYLNGATPIPVEAGYDHLIDPESIKKAITSKTKAIITTQLNGRTSNMDIIQSIAKENDLVIIEDSAQALGSKFKEIHAGTFGIGGCISFYPAKVLGCFGDGGMILTNSEIINNKARLIRDHGRDPKTGDVVMWGRN
nr:aminotransferase class V-fold PLP-dependent enzyme [Bacteroidota bacterium]